MDIQRAKEEIKNSVAAYLMKDEDGDYRIPEIRQRPILLMGPPGIGKTQIMEQIAREMNLALCAYTITHHTRQSAIGLPFIKEKVYGGKKYSVTEYTMSEIIASIYDKIEASGKPEGLLFIDEINCVSETLAPAMLQFLQCKTFGNQKVPEGWIIVAAGNPPEYNKSVRDFDVVTLDRVKVIDVEPDFETWKKYAYAVGIHSAVISYLDIHRENFYRCETTVDGKRFVTARGWEDLSEMIFAYEALHAADSHFMGKIDEAVAVQYLQYPSIAKDFANYLELYYKYRREYRIDEILSGNVPDVVLERLRYAPFDERVEIVSLILSKLCGDFLAMQERDTTLGHLFTLLKTFRGKLAVVETSAGGDRSAAAAGAGGSGPAADSVSTPSEIFAELLSELRQSVDARAAAGQNEKALRREFRDVWKSTDEDLLLLKDPALGRDGESAFAALRESFRKKRDEHESACAAVSEELEHAFDFMEAAFGESTEMVFFITELSANEHAMWFLRENECPRYYRYNKSLLFEDNEKAIRRDIDKIRSDMAGEGKKV